MKIKVYQTKSLFKKLNQHKYLFIKVTNSQEEQSP